MHLPKIPIKYFRGDPWTIVEEGFDPSYQRMSESVFSLANEFMGVRGYFEEGYSVDHLLGSYFNHLYEMMDIHHDQVGMMLAGQADALVARLRAENLGRLLFEHGRGTCFPGWLSGRGLCRGHGTTCRRHAALE